MSTMRSIAAQRLRIALVFMQSKPVGPILEDLFERDSRFLFIKMSFDEFLYGKFGQGPDEMHVDLTPRRYRSAYEDDFYLYLDILLHDIVNTAIYELLNVFDIDITPEQALETDHSSKGNIALLEALYEESKNLVPQPAKTIPLDHPTPSSQAGHDYQYQKRLGPSNIRVLRIQPGLKESPIECQLEECSLISDRVEEALSYVWGEPIFNKTIKIDGSSFRITTNLNNILHSLRHRDVARTIWIDAVCINQSDMEEKVHQVRLMRDIYSKGHKTSIWLGHWPQEQMIPELNLMDDPTNVLAPAPEGFGGVLMDQYDLVSILEKILEYQTDSAWDEKRLALSIMLIRCVNIIKMHKWWERVWTIQEAALPQNEPIIYFRDYSFSLSTMISAMDAVARIDEMSDPLPDFPGPPLTIYTMHIALLSQILHWRAKRGNEPFLRFLRPETQTEMHISNPQDRLFPLLLRAVNAYRATDPRDKIFALESLLIRSAGLLINVDYNESTEAVFRRITARCLNQLWEDHISLYKLLVEQQNSLGNNPLGPSWVHDFAYSDVDSQNEGAGETTLHGFLRREETCHPMYENTSGHVCI
ncbi:hypothetical protein M434DRAFT_28962 [Hypoxylon sp. CO27-5]|nr:hypothetical protein M434DRAFT_28962 [Hypoxylon sp. CO27-5]